MACMATFDVVVSTDTMIVLVDTDQGMSVTNDAYAVVGWLERNLKGGIGRRRTYYRDSMGQYDELIASEGIFIGFRPCSASQQGWLDQLASNSPALLSHTPASKGSAPLDIYY